MPRSSAITTKRSKRADPYAARLMRWIAPALPHRLEGPYPLDVALPLCARSSSACDVGMADRRAGRPWRPARRPPRGDPHDPRSPPALPPPRPERGRGGRSVTPKVMAVTAGARAGAPCLWRVDALVSVIPADAEPGETVLGTSTSSTTPKRRPAPWTRTQRPPDLRSWSMSHLHYSLQARSISLGPAEPGSARLGRRCLCGHRWPPLGPLGFTEGPTSFLASVATGLRTAICSKGGC